MKPCSVANCGKVASAKGFCKLHYMRAHRHGNPLVNKRTFSAASAWLEHHKDFNGEECLIWPFGRFSFGYGAVEIAGRTRYVHRIMCEHRHGPPPTPQHDAAHNCGNGRLGCVNPLHLRWATTTENLADRLTHGTHGRGERNSQSKLTTAAVLAIRAATNVSRKELGLQYRVNRKTIADVITRRSWDWLT